MSHLLLLLVICSAIRGQEIGHLTDNNWTNSSAVDHSERGVSDSLLSIIRFNRVQCLGSNGQEGTCYSRIECSNLQGTISGACSFNWGVCCTIQRSCDSRTNVNAIYFTNPDFPAASKDLPALCPIRVSKINPNICQLRIDFLDFTLAQPDGDGNCADDYLEITGSDFPVLKLCGENSDQHVYVDIQQRNTAVQLTIVTKQTVSISRKWNIKITQIECTSPYRAPSGYLMYFRGIEGHVKSFNYPASGSSGTRQLQSSKYGVGVEPAPGYCSIKWMQDPNDPYSFTLTEDTFSATSNLGTAMAASTGAQCTTDFVVIPNPSQEKMELPHDRFCGNALLPTTTSVRPFMLTVVTDDSEAQDIGNRGFSLKYHQIKC